MVRVVFRIGRPEYSDFPPPLIDAGFSIVGNAELRDQSDSQLSEITIPAVLRIYRSSEWQAYSVVFEESQSLVIETVSLDEDERAECHETLRAFKRSDISGVISVCFTDVDPPVLYAAVRLTDIHYDLLKRIANSTTASPSDLPEIELEYLEPEATESGDHEDACIAWHWFWEGFPGLVNTYRLAFSNAPARSRDSLVRP